MFGRSKQPTELIDKRNKPNAVEALSDEVVNILYERGYRRFAEHTGV